VVSAYATAPTIRMPMDGETPEPSSDELQPAVVVMRRTGVSPRHRREPAMMLKDKVAVIYGAWRQLRSGCVSTQPGSTRSTSIRGRDGVSSPMDLSARRTFRRSVHERRPGRSKDLERENATLKRLLAEAELENAALKEIARGTSEPGPASGRRSSPYGGDADQ
jgi:hypothetical protein